MEAIRNNPELAAANAEILIRQGQVRQAGLLPNPVISYEIEDFGGNRELAGIKSLEQTARISQEIELGGKRSNRKKLARSDLALAEIEYSAKLLDLVAEVKIAFHGLLAAQRMDSLASEKVRLAQEVYNTVVERVKAGKVSPVELSRAEVTLSMAEIETGRASAELKAARQALAKLWGAEVVTFERAEGDLEQVDKPEELSVLLPRLEENPDLQIQRESLTGREAALGLARAGRVPDLEIGGGTKSLRESGNQAFVAQISIPLPLFDRNQGEVATAAGAREQAEYRLDEMRTKLVEALTGTHAELTATYDEVVSMRERVLKGATSVFQATRIGYAEGKFSYLDLLDAQRSLFEAKASYIDALYRYQANKARLERLVGLGANRIENVSAEEN